MSKDKLLVGMMAVLAIATVAMARTPFQVIADPIFQEVLEAGPLKPWHNEPCTGNEAIDFLDCAGLGVIVHVTGGYTGGHYPSRRFSVTLDPSGYSVTKDLDGNGNGLAFLMRDTDDTSVTVKWSCVSKSETRELNCSHGQCDGSEGVASIYCGYRWDHWVDINLTGKWGELYEVSMPGNPYGKAITGQFDLSGTATVRFAVSGNPGPFTFDIVWGCGMTLTYSRNCAFRCFDNSTFVGRCKFANANYAVLGYGKKFEIGQNYEVCLDGERCLTAVANSRGKFKVKFSDVAEGEHTLTQTECELQATVTCP